MELFKDKLALGATAGFIADIIQDIVQIPLLRLGLIKTDLDALAGSLFNRVRNEALVMDLWSRFLGFFSGLALSMILGIVFVYTIQISGFRLVKCKGVLFGFFTWFLIYGGACSGLHLSPIPDYNPKHILTQLFVHLLFGYILGLFVSKQGGLIFHNGST